jgi:hypothetical protein
MDFTSLFSGVGVSLGAVAAVKIWRAQSPKLPTAFQRVMDWFEGRTGIDIPDNTEARVVQAVRDGVLFADQTFGSKLWWRTMIRLAMRDSGAGLVERLEAWASTIDPIALIETQLPDDIRILSNQAKTEIAARVSNGPVLALNPNAKPEQVRAMVTVLARSVIPRSDNERPNLEEVLIATRARIAALKASMPVK